MLLTARSAAVKFRAEEAVTNFALSNYSQELEHFDEVCLLACAAVLLTIVCNHVWIMSTSTAAQTQRAVPYVCWPQITREELVFSLRKQSKGFQRASSQFRGVTHHQKGKWEARIGQVCGLVHAVRNLHPMLQCRAPGAAIHRSVVLFGYSTWQTSAHHVFLQMVGRKYKYLGLYDTGAQLHALAFTWHGVCNGQ
jgi:hypothetical protein